MVLYLRYQVPREFNYCTYLTFAGGGMYSEILLTMGHGITLLYLVLLSQYMMV